MAKVKFKGIKVDTIIDIKVSGYFYNKILNVIMMLGQSVTPTEFAQALNNIKEDKERNGLLESNLEVLIALLTEIEKQAFEQDKTTEEEIDVPDEPTGSSPQQGPQSE